MGDSTIDLKNFAATALIVFLFTSSMLWLNWNNVSPGYAHFNKYGVDLTYPKLMNLREAGLSDLGFGSDPSDFSGLIQCQSYWEDKLDILEVIWLVKNKASSPKADLKELLMMMSPSNDNVKSVGEYYIITLQGEETTCINIEVKEGANTFSGVVGVIYRPWSSQGVTRVFFVAYATFKGSASEEQIRSNLLKYAEGLSIS